MARSQASAWERKILAEAPDSPPIKLATIKYKKLAADC
jgi:hypothetical protein